MLRIITLLSFCLLSILGHAQDKSIWFAQKKYSDHALVKFRTIRNRDLPFNAQLYQYAPLPQRRPDSIDNKKWLLAYYTETIQQAFQKQIPDRAYLTDSLALQQLNAFKEPSTGYRLYYSRTRRSDKIKYIRYAISKGLPVMVGFDHMPDPAPHQGETTWDGNGREGTFRLLIVGYDSPTASFQLVSDQGDQWGDHGYIWMTYLDLLAKAEEVLCLKNPTTVSKPKSAEKLASPIMLGLNVEVKKLDQPEDKSANLALLTPHFDKKQTTYQFGHDEPITTEDRFQVTLQIPKGRCTYIFAAQPDGTATPAWTMEYNPGDTLVTLPPVSYYQFPDEGQHQFFILHSYQPIPRWRRYVDRFEENEQQLSPGEKLYQAFKAFLLPSGKTDYQSELIRAQIQLTTPSDQYVMPVILEWNVKE